MTYTYQCSACLRPFVLPMMKDNDVREGIAPKLAEYVLVCVCGTENRYPLMAVLPFPPKEASLNA